MLQRANRNKLLQRRIWRSAVERGLSQRRLFEWRLLRSDGGVGGSAAFPMAGGFPNAGASGSAGRAAPRSAVRTPFDFLISGQSDGDGGVLGTLAIQGAGM